MEEEFGIIVFPEVKNYHTVRLEQILSGEHNIAGNCIIEETNLDKHELRVKFIGKLEESTKPMPIGLLSPEGNVIMLMPKAEIAINGSKAVVKWHDIKRRSALSGVMFIPLLEQKA